MRRTILFLSAILALAFAPACRGDGLGTLIQVGRSMDEIQRDYEKDTATYNRVKDAIGKGSIKKGLAQSEALKCGMPIAIVTESATKRQVWVYRPGTTDLLNKPKIRLFFDEKGAIDEISVLE